MKKSILIGIAVIIGVSVNPIAQAVECPLNPKGPAIDTIVALQGGYITVGQDVPNGTVIFRQFFKPSHSLEINCQNSSTVWQWSLRSLYTTNPKPLTQWNSGMFAGKLYDSGIPGIGVSAWWNGNVIPFLRASGSVNPNILFTYFPIAEFDISFVKIGPVSPGVIRGQDLPTVALDFIPQGGSTVRALRVGYSGALNVVSQTCTTPNPVVQLGKYEISTVFNRLNAVTGWADASIILTNCPRFYGTMDSGRSNYGSDSPTDRGQAGTPQNNQLGVILRPNTAILDAAKGIIGLRAEPNVATGVGIQLATAISGADVTAAEFNIEKRYTMRNSSETTYKIPLNARYIQTNAKVTPGPANATLTYTINYY